MIRLIRARFPHVLSAVVMCVGCTFWSFTFAATADDDANALRLKDAGNAAMDEHHYEDAVQRFEDSYALAKNPAVLYNKARALEAMGEYPRALETIREFDRLAPADLKAKVNGLDKVMADIRARVATLSITCTVGSAEVRINDRGAGTTLEGKAVTMRLKAGAVHIEMVKEGYFHVVRDLRIDGNKTAALTVDLPSKVTQGNVRIESRAGAVVTLDGHEEGMAPLEKSLPAGNHTVRLSLDGFEPSERTFVVNPGSSKTLQVDDLRTTPITKTWWFWTTIGAGIVVAGAAIGGVVYASNKEKPADRGKFGQVPAGISF